MKKLSFILVLLLICSFIFSEEQKMESKKPILVIQNFADQSSLQKAGAKIGDNIQKYDGKDVSSLQTLGELKKQVNTDEVEIILKRDAKMLTLKIPKGQLGVYLKELMPDHMFAEDAKIIDDLGKLDWGIGMENSFLGCVYLLEQKFGYKLSYNDIVGISGYAFRNHFFAGFCPSSPDATVGYNNGGKILSELGYKGNFYHLKNSETVDADLERKNKDEMLDIIKASIDKGFPVIAIDLIEIAEWGLITGYQNDGKDLLCRTYYDKTQGYEIAEKFPWAIYVVDDKDINEIIPLYDKSLQIALEMYQTEKYENYFSGISALVIWIEELQNEEQYSKLDEVKLEEAQHANWWIYLSMMDARRIAVEYLKNNLEKFSFTKMELDKLINIYEKEDKLLQTEFEKIPSAMSAEKIEWTQEMREQQIKVLTELNKLELEALEIIKTFQN